jgi:hypothetical protein
MQATEKWKQDRKVEASSAPFLNDYKYKHKRRCLSKSTSIRNTKARQTLNYKDIKKWARRLR